MYRYSNFTYGPQDWAFDSYNDGQVISYYLNAYYQCFLLLMGNNQVRAERKISREGVEAGFPVDCTSPELTRKGLVRSFLPSFWKEGVACGSRGMCVRIGAWGTVAWKVWRFGVLGMRHGARLVGREFQWELGAVRCLPAPCSQVSP